MASPLRIDFGCSMTEITRRGEASLLLGRQDSQGMGEGKFKIQDLTPHSLTKTLGLRMQLPSKRSWWMDFNIGLLQGGPRYKVIGPNQRP